MADASGVPENGEGRGRFDVLDQGVGAPRYNQVDAVVTKVNAAPRGLFYLRGLTAASVNRNTFGATGEREQQRESNEWRVHQLRT